MIRGGYYMKDWMTIKDLSEYLELSKSKIRFLIKQKSIPLSNRLGEARFNKTEIDKWMKGEVSTKMEHLQETHDEETNFPYRGKPIKENKLTANIVLIGETPLKRLPEFIKHTVEKVKSIGRSYLYHEEFKPFLNNFNDYLRISCQLGLINNLKKEERRKHYYPTEFAGRIYLETDAIKIKQLILESIINIVQNNIEFHPDEKHAVLLLWYFLTLKEKGIEPTEYHFKLDKDKRNNYYPRIRLSFISSLNHFLFEDNEKKESEFLSKWNSLI
jgi:excisionase family DNA binding protein